MGDYSWLSIFDPSAIATGTIDVDQLPDIGSSQQAKELIYNTTGSLISTGAAAAITAYVANMLWKRKWDREHAKVMDAKLNALKPISTPNYDLSSQGISTMEEVRQLGLPKQAGFWDLVVRGSLPFAAGAIGIAGGKLIGDKVAEDAITLSLDEQIKEQRNKLDALHAKLYDLTINKEASEKAEDNSDDKPTVTVINTPTDTPSLLTGLGTTGVLSLGTLFALPAFAGYQYFKSKDINRKKLKRLKELAAQNLTNIPTEVTLQLSDLARPAIDAQQQQVDYMREWREDMQNASKRAPEKDSQNLKTKKDAIFF